AVGDDAALDLRGALEDGGEPRVPPVALHGIFGRVAVATVYLETGAGHALGHLGGEELDHRRLALDRDAVVTLLRHLIHEGPRRLDLGCHVGELEPDRLERRDRAVELHAGLRVGERVLERTAGEPDGARRGVDAGDVEAMERGVEGALPLRRRSLTEGADAVPRRHAQAVEPEMECGEAEVADLVDRPGAEPIRELATLLLDDERHEAAGLRLTGLGVPIAAEEQ